MSLQPPPQQPVQVYPTAVTNQPSSHHSNGNYGPVFIVLAILLVISVVGCFLGRLCNRRKDNNNSHNNQNHQRGAPPSRRGVKPNRQQQIHDLQSREDDIELGIGNDKRMPPPIITRPRVVAFEPEGRGSQPHGNVNRNVNDFEMKSDHEGDQFRTGLRQ